MKLSAANAIKILQSVLDECGPQSVAFLVAPNVILTLAGARAYADGVFYHPQSKQLDEWLDELQRLADFLRQNQDFWIKTERSTNPSGVQYVGFDLLYRPGLITSLADYSFIPPAAASKVARKPLSPGLMDDLSDLVKASGKAAKWPPDSIDYVRNGILLGYPEKAVLETREYAEGDRPNEPYVEAAIKQATYYEGPQPIYQYPRKLVDDPDIRRHERLWSEILEGYYASDFHRQLEKNISFRAKITALQKY